MTEVDKITDGYPYVPGWNAKIPLQNGNNFHFGLYPNGPSGGNEVNFFIADSNGNLVKQIYWNDIQESYVRTAGGPLAYVRALLEQVNKILGASSGNDGEYKKLSSALQEVSKILANNVGYKEPPELFIK